MSLGIAGVDFQGMVKHFNAPGVLPQVAQCAARATQDFRAPVIKPDRMVDGTHALFGVACSGFEDSEVSLAHQTIADLKPGMLCLADRSLAGFSLWQAVNTVRRKLPVYGAISP